MKSESMGWAVHVTRTREIKNNYSNSRKGRDHFEELRIDGG